MSRSRKTEEYTPSQEDIQYFESEQDELDQSWPERPDYVDLYDPAFDSNLHCPDTPRAVAHWFDRIRDGSFNTEFENDKAHSAYRSITDILSAKYGHLDEADLHDDPQAALLLTGESAALRILRYDNFTIDPTERTKDWKQTLTAFAFTLKPEDSKPIWEAIEEHGSY